MTEPKKEKCEACYGSGYINFWTDDGHISMRTCRRCDGYGYIKAKRMTNEEWLKSANTEQLAEVFYIVFHNNADRVLNAFWDKNKEVFKKNVVEWLKQPHTTIKE
jgi:hypothetical protein